MAVSSPKQPPARVRSLVLICGEDDFSVKERARQLYNQWTTELGGMDHEILDGSVSNGGEALHVLAKLREALQTLPFFGSGKAIWLRSCSFLGDERAASAQAVTLALADLAAELQAFTWDNVRLLISAGKVDKRKTLYKTLDKIGEVENFDGWSIDSKDWSDQAESWALRAVQSRKKSISEGALAELVSRVGPNSRLLDNEIEKLSLYIGDKPEIEVNDVAAVCSRNKNARAFALGDALGDRDLPQLLRRLDEELWEMKLDRSRSEIGLLYGLISKVRAMLLLKEMLREGWVKSEASYARFKDQLGRLPDDQLPSDKRFNPKLINAFVLFKALPQAKRYTEAELVRAMELLLECNQRLVTSNLEESLVLHQTLVQIVGTGSQPRSFHSRP